MAKFTNTKPINKIAFISADIDPIIPYISLRIDGNALILLKGRSTRSARKDLS